MSDPSIPSGAQPSINSRSPPFVTTSIEEGKTDRQEPRVRRRNRIIKSCLECRRRKLKCDKIQPCTNCVKVSRQCLFIAPGSDPVAQAKLAEVKEKMGILERSLEADLAQKRRNEALGSEDDEDDEIHNLNPSQMAEDDAAYYEDEEANDDIVDLGIAMGKVRITERIGGMMRPKFSDELSQSLREVPDQDPHTSSTFPDGTDDWMLPSQEFVAPSSSFMFAPGVERTSIMHYLPSRILVDKLMTHYWEAVHIIARTVHRPSFERQYSRFWEDVSAGTEPRASFQAVVFAALLSSVISMSEDHVHHEFGVNRQSLIENFRQGTESALSRANLLRTTKLETLQAFVMYLIPLCRAEVSRAHSALMGTCIRLAECMGLHRDPSAYSSSPIECQVRRLIWHQICFLDIRTCEATGPRPQIRLDDYDTQFPANIDDADLDRAESDEEGTEFKDRNHFTDMTITRMRFECYEMHRILWVERSKIGAKKKEGERTVTLTSLLARIQSFRARMEKIYSPMLNRSIPLHVLASKYYEIAADRLYIHILQRFLSSDKYAMPDRLRQITMGASVRILEHSMDIERQPALAIWSWYTGALHQYHASLLLLNEMYIAHIDPSLEQRIWTCLDYTFELPAGGSGVAKIRMILKDLIGKLDIYSNVRRWRAPKDMPQAGRRLHAAGHPSQQKEGAEARERQDRSTSLQSTGSSDQGRSYTSSENLPPQPTPYSHQPPFYSPQNPPSQTIGFPGSMPQTDWGTFNAPVTSSTYQYPPASAMPPISAVSTGPWVPPATSPETLPNPNQAPSGIPFSSGGVPSSNTTPATAKASNPPDPLGDVDWNEIDQLFHGTQAGAGNMMSMPFTFPSYETAGSQPPRDSLR